MEDRAREGKLSKAQLKNLMAAHIDVSLSNLIFQELDFDNDGLASEPEFLRACSKQMTTEDNHLLEKVFMFLDTEK
jgi:Ca2+-binding EF-hand superfamily protein